MPFCDLTQLRRRYSGQAGQLVNDFYVPVLRQSVRYDRQTGFFDSASLVQLASGLAGFIQQVRQLATVPSPPMRLITGATWHPDDIAAYKRGEEALEGSLNGTLLRHFEPSDDECVRLGLPLGWRPEEDQIARNRLGTLAWMVATGLLEVRVALPLDHNGRPYQPGRQGALYHPKAGILYDAQGDVIVFQGSVNETGAAWTRNREKFDVRRSWFSDQDREDIEAEVEEFEEIWRGRDPGLLVKALPQAVKDHLRSFIPPDGPPDHDPLEITIDDREIPLEDRVAAQAFLDAAKQPGGERLVLEPLWADGLPFQPFPHQKTVYDRAVAEFPRSFLFCDEVGLGKTIEAGLGLRTLILTGDVSRVLILAPRSLVRQWMEELREKMALTAWFYDGRVLQDVAGRIRRTDNPWDEDGIVIASRHLVARADRMDTLLSASRPWDVVIVDEAHAARRRVFGHQEPNYALQLLQGLRDRRLYRSLWLLTATPMQLEPYEVHDLLLICGLDDAGWKQWSDLGQFQGFFERLRDFHRNRDARPYVVDMTRIAVARGAAELNKDQVPANWTAFRWRNFVDTVARRGPGVTLALQQMTGAQAEAMTPYLARQTPLSVHMFRYTRATLRAYQERGLVHGLATRRPEDVPVSFRSQVETQLYDRIDELCSEFYRLADLPPEERSGVGFLMAVFRKRLASSFYSFRRSLERRRDLIAAIQNDLSRIDAELEQERQLLDEEEDEDDDEADVRSLLDRERRRLVRLYEDPERREQLENERKYLHDYIGRLAQIPIDSKFEVFEERLIRLVDDGHRVIVFTQYLDTLDFIRNRLVARYGQRIACYSGRGGEVWDGGLNGWRLVPKSEVKARSRTDHPQAISILLGTDAASEGLNLQQFSALFNYDLPWNPMRVEQRIGRIDRIGQASAEVQILNLYVENTIEEDTYVTLKNRINLFEEVVGPLQPILAEMPRILRRVARGELELAEARRLLDEAAEAKPRVAIESLDNCVRDVSGPGPASAPAGASASVSQSELAAWCLAHPAPGMRIVTVPEPGTQSVPPDGLRGCLSIAWPYAPPHLGIDSDEEVLATFDGELADRHPPTGPSEASDGTVTPGREGVRLLTWGDPLLTAWLEMIRGEPLQADERRNAELSNVEAHGSCVPTSRC